MTFQELTTIFLSKYTEGSISKNGNKYLVTFNKNSKAYAYNCSSYAEMLKRLGFEVIYKNQLKSVYEEIERLENEIKTNGYNDLFSDDFIEYSENELFNLKHELQHQKKKLEYVIV